MKKQTIWKWCAVGALVAMAGCGGNQAGTEGGGDANGAGGGNSAGANGASTAALSGEIKGDGSSTVFPITEAVAEEFGKSNPDVKVTVGNSGTGGGFKKFIGGDTVISNASRPIKDKEAKSAAEKKIEYIELPVAYDGLSVVVNPKNTWAKTLTVAELKKIWDKGSKINNWSQVRAGFPNKPLKLYGPGTDSGTFDYFTDEINGEEGRSRSDYTASEDDNTLVQGVSRDEGALGYFGFAYYEQNQDKLKLVGIDSGDGKAVMPSQETINNGTYKPLSRPLFVYVERKAADRPEIQAFINYYLTNVKDMAKQVGYVPLPDSVYTAAQQRFQSKKVGSAYADKGAKDKRLEDLYKAA